jgi:predicted nuclease with TOPRIM domain
MVDKSKMMNSLAKNLPAEKQSKAIAIPEQNKDINDDYEYSREKYKGIIDRGEEALEGMMQLAAESEHPRAYEVLSGMLKNMADVTDKLMDLQKKTHDLKTKKEEQNPAPQGLTQNNVFVGSTTDLQRMLLDNNKSEVIDVDTDK